MIHKTKILAGLALGFLLGSAGLLFAQSATPDPTHFRMPGLGWIIDSTPLLLFGLAGQILFTARMLVQAWASKRAGRSVVPPEFWHLSALAGAVLMTYFYVRSDPVGVLHQAVMLGIYLRNIYLLHREVLPRRIRRGGAAIIGAVFALVSALFMLAIWREGPREVMNQPDPQSFVLPLLGLVVPAWPILTLGFLGAGVFSGRFIVQWLASERARRSVIPNSFWWMALAGNIMLLLYFIVRSDPIGVLGQLTGAPVYCYNLYLIYWKAEKNKASQPVENP
ncbi:lipid-A-disaccharide synthase N-terminal domain-containing protein [Candidatus Sumerlaeota bacterium]|nr:lipid-A-disaccharide synthase N-terminal domain-containing protein [Candidatus Sumerlaeota bacterium]